MYGSFGEDESIECAVLKYNFFKIYLSEDSNFKTSPF